MGEIGIGGVKKLDRFAAAWRAACQGGSTIATTFTIPPELLQTQKIE